MLKLVVCLKQVPKVSELPWDARTGTLKRNLAGGMMDPASKHALESSLLLKRHHGGTITAITMGPETAEEILREAVAMGADQGILLCDPLMSGADTLATSYTLARAIEKECPNFDLVFCGCHTSDSETAQVGPQLTEELRVAGVSYVETFQLKERVLRIQRVVDNFLETLEMDLPALVTMTTNQNSPRYPSFSGLQNAFDEDVIRRLTVEDLHLNPELIGVLGSPTQIRKVYSPLSKKENVILKGAAGKIVERLFNTFDDKIGGATGKDLKEYEQNE
jgi:electron transfer flavoprotein beta subunit